MICPNIKYKELAYMKLHQPEVYDNFMNMVEKWESRFGSTYFQSKSKYNVDYVRNIVDKNIYLNYYQRNIQKGGDIVPKDTYIRIRLTAEQKEQIKKAAKRKKTNMSDFVLTATRNTIANGEK